MSKMKTMKYFLMAFTALTLISCGGGDEPEPDPKPTPTPTPTEKGKFLTQTCNMPAEASETVVSLYGLTTAIDRYSQPDKWLTVIRQAYTSGTPSVQLTATENMASEARQQDVTFYAGRDTLVLTVRQAVYNASSGADMDNTHDTPTDQPAYIPRKD
jgi:hypothetical protein